MSGKRYTYSQLNNGQYSVDYITFEEIYGEENMFHSRICEVNNKKQAQNVINLLNEKEDRIKELQQTIDTIEKDYEESHGMDIRNAEWFTAW